jgi:hypothetical protein
MKKHIVRFLAIGAFLAFALPYNLKAQNHIWSIGPEIGANFSKYGNDASGNIKPGFIGGLSLTYSIENTHALTGKLLFAQKGAKINGINQSLNYIEMPLVGRFFFNRNGNFRPNIFIGPSLGILTGATNVKVGESNPTSIHNYSDIYRPLDFGVTGGLGLNFLIARETRLLFDARYTHGLTDITKSSGYINNKAISLTAGVSFGISR